MAISSNLSPVENDLKSFWDAPLPPDCEPLLLFYHYDDNRDFKYMLIDTHTKSGRYAIFDVSEYTFKDEVTIDDINDALVALYDFVKNEINNGFFDNNGFNKVLMDKDKLQRLGIEKDFLNLYDEINRQQDMSDEYHERMFAAAAATKNGKSAKEKFYYLLNNAYQNPYIDDYTIEAAKNAKIFLKWSDSSIKAAITKFAPEAAYDRPGVCYADKVIDIINAADKRASVTR